MAFIYRPLENPREDIRLLSLLPGGVDDPLQCIIRHTSLPDLPPGIVSGSYDISEIQKTLPEGWSATQTHEYRLMFEHEATETISWSHPDPQFDHTQFEPPPPPQPAGPVPAYEALSYVWGSAADHQFALVANAGAHSNSVSGPHNGPPPDFLPLRITRNLAEALTSLRLPDEARTLWIDAICINQEDKAERNHQVLRMAALYTMARRVLIWLGPESPDSGEAMSTLDYLGSQVEISINTARFASPDAVEKRWYRAEVPLPYSASTWDAIQALFWRPYFERVWVTQEVILANPQAVVICGPHEAPWRNFVRAIICLGTKHDIAPGLRDRFNHIRTLTWKHSDISLFLILNMMRRQQCSDLRDKVYGVLGITPPGFSRRIQPDYQLPISEVFKNAFLAALEHTNRLVLLQDCELLGPSTPWPSWVPDWSVSRKSNLLSAFTFASGISRSHHRFIEPDTLEVLGRRVGRIREASAFCPDTPLAALEHVRTWAPAGLLTEAYAAGGSLLDAFLLTLRLGYVRERFPCGTAGTLATWREFFLDRLHNTSEPLQTDDIAHDGEVYWTTVFTKSRCFVTTDEGYIGLGPPGVMAGDVACSILGSNSLIVLREAPDGRHRVVGECYIQGMDDATGILGPLPDCWAVEVDKDSSGFGLHQFRNHHTDILTSEDPRLPPLSPPWQALETEREPGGPAIWACYQNELNGEVIHSDPRLLPESLEERGIELESFKLC
ncbi:related to heterokaryon incompatibility protein [Cephalotrichum gorgonifer]|uniref:Related to heterokaryon incompatibility protein n=1 Tax=Cephalotrichum gorgonifer TaxID=2041049 RepID=A0AAE8MTN1_9PEZI|nr:related to heterokaryon incompatibility protein [Cephalotrichum gorgonifer]